MKFLYVGSYPEKFVNEENCMSKSGSKHANEALKRFENATFACLPQSVDSRI